MHGLHRMIRIPASRPGYRAAATRARQCGIHWQRAAAAPLPPAVDLRSARRRRVVASDGRADWKRGQAQQNLFFCASAASFI